jgi:hypothetical protein
MVIGIARPMSADEITNWKAGRVALLGDDRFRAAN